MKKEFIEQLIIVELDRATRQHPEWPDDIIHAAAVIMEEAGELMKACLDLVYFGGDKRAVRNEVVSVAAMAERFMLHFPEYYKIMKRFSHTPRIGYGLEYDQLERMKLLDPRFKRKKGIENTFSPFAKSLLPQFRKKMKDEKIHPDSS